VSSRASGLAQADLAQGQIEVIVYYKEVAQRNVVSMYQASHGFAAEIHKCPRPGQHQLLTAYFANPYSSLALPVVKVDGMKPGEVIQALEANIMAIAGISLTGIP
jgi:hypothetical protein